MSPVIDCTSDEAVEGAAATATAALRRGGLVVMPTDTVYGLAADAFDRHAVQRLLNAKSRGREMPVAVLIADRRTVDGLAASVPTYATALMDEFWPGPLTVVLRAHSSLSWDLGETKGTVALRIPDHEVAREVLTQAGPLAVSSANVTGEPAATTVLAAASMLGSDVEVYLDAGECASSQVSTFVDCTGEAPEILREGAITQEQIDQAVEGLCSPESDDEPGPPTDRAPQDATPPPEDEPAR